MAAEEEEAAEAEAVLLSAPCCAVGTAAVVLVRDGLEASAGLPGRVEIWQQARCTNCVLCVCVVCCVCVDVGCKSEASREEKGRKEGREREKNMVT